MSVHLSRIPTLAVLEHDALRLLAVGAETLNLRKGEILFRRDEPSDGGYVLVSGAIALDPSDHGGQAEQIVRPPVAHRRYGADHQDAAAGDRHRARALRPC